MVCKKCEKKLSKLATPDVWKKGARNTIGGKDGGIKLGVNKLIKKRKMGYGAVGSMAQKCCGCKKRLIQKHKYCNLCAYKIGRCKVCGIKILKTTNYKQTNV